MNLTLGILAHVDAGKTTLSEAMLYASGTIHRLGRVDSRDTYLDGGEQERLRGITITAKQASFSLPGGVEVTLIDTPGHTDFASEAEAVLPVLDCAILLISRSDGVTAHTETLWRLLARHRVPVMVFVNKTDLAGQEEGEILRALRAAFGSGFLDAREGLFGEEAALCEEALTEEYLETGGLSEASVRGAIAKRKMFPCFFGSALKMDGVAALMDALARIAPRFVPPPEGAMLGGKVFRIAYDGKGNRVTHLKLTSGCIKARSVLTLHRKNGERVEEKIDRMALQVGKGEQVVETLVAGQVAMLTGLTATQVGMGIGCEESAPEATLRPVMSYRMALPTGCSAYEWLPRLKRLEEENPLLALTYEERTGEIRIHLTGEVQLEVLEAEILRRFGLAVRFDAGSLLLRETITRTVEGVGHFEPLRHYAEVHLLLEPLGQGEGLQIASSCPPNLISMGWQRGILDVLRAQTLTGVLTDSPLTDMKITLISGRAHPKHTEPGDFAEAAGRALRQGLMRAESVLLEPYYEFRLALPGECLGRAMTDLEMRGARFEAPTEESGGFVLCGVAPVAAMRDYLPEIPAYTRGRGRISVRPGPYLPSERQAALVAERGYRAEADPAHPADSIFCKNGAGYSVPWQMAEGMMHVPTRRRARSAQKREENRSKRAARRGNDFEAEERELLAIFERTYGPIRRKSAPEKKQVMAQAVEEGVLMEPIREYVLVDAYNVIFSWEELREAAEESLDLARSMLLHMLINYQGYRGCRLIVVFDAYRTAGGRGSVEETDGVWVVYTKEAETADTFIERVCYRLGQSGKERRRVRVVTSDGPEGLIVLGSGASRVASDSFREEVLRVSEEIRELLDALGKARGENTEEAEGRP